MREVFKNVETFLHKFVRVQYDKSICIICINFNNTQNFPFCGISKFRIKVIAALHQTQGENEKKFWTADKHGMQPHYQTRIRKVLVSDQTLP